MNKRTQKTLISLVLITVLSFMTCNSVFAASNHYPMHYTYVYEDGRTEEIANCTYVAWQQAYDRLGIDIPKWGNATDWYSQANGVFPRGSEPRVNSIVCYSGNPGHVAYVIEVNGNQITVIENGHWNGTYESSLATRPRSGAVGSKYGANTLQGYIYLVPIANIQLWAIEEGETVNGTVKLWAKRSNEDPNHYAVFYLDDVPMTEHLYSDNNGYFSVELDTTNYADGTHQLSVYYAYTYGDGWDVKHIVFNNANNPVQTFELDVNGWTDNAENGWVGGYATFDLYINGSRVADADDINDYCAQISAGSSYEIKDIKVADGKAFDGFSSYTRSGYTSGSRMGTVNGNTDVRLQLHTVNAAGFIQAHSPVSISPYNGHSYIFFSSPTTWYDAKIISEHLGGQLVTITSAAEETFIKGMIGSSDLWIGATDRDSEGTWKWVTGETFSYSNWGEDQPDNTASPGEGSENYAHIRGSTGKWNDNAGCEAFPFICELDRAYTVSYNANGGSGAPSAQAKAVGQTIMLSTVRPTREGYNFLGWATSANATAAQYQPGDNYSTDDDLTLYAVWKANTTYYTITYNANGGTGAPANQTKTHGTALTLSSTKPTRANSSAGSYTVTLNANGGTCSTASLTAKRTTKYTFRNWNTAQNGSGTSYNPGASYTANAAATLYAQWNSSTSTAAVTLPTPTRSGYAFGGWATSSNATSGVTGSYTPSGNVTLYAVWVKPDFILPSALITIEDEAFAGGAFTYVKLSENTASIGKNAFANCPNLAYIYIPGTNIEIDPDAFGTRTALTIFGKAGSNAAAYAQQKGFTFIAVS